MTAFPFKRREVRGAEAPPRAAAAPRITFLECVHLFVLATFAITQPLYDRLGESPAFLEDSGFSLSGVLLLMALVSVGIPLIPPLLAWGLGRIAPSARDAVQVIVVFVLLAIVMLPVFKRLPEGMMPAWGVIGGSLTAAALATAAYFSVRQVRSIVTVAAVGIVAFPAWYAWNSQTPAALRESRRIAVSRGPPVPVVMLVLDELCGMELVDGNREIDAVRFPNFAELARGSTWFRNATTVVPVTSEALPVILSGQYPKYNFAPRPRELPQNLFSILETSGEYELAVFEPISRLASHRIELAENAPQSAAAQVAAVAPTLSRVYLQHLAPVQLQKSLPIIPPLWFGLGRGSQFDREARRGVFRYRWGDDRLGQFEHFLECLDDSPQPALFFCHILLPHVPWNYLPSGRRYLAESAQYELLDFDTYSGELDLWGTDELYISQSQQRHLLQLQFTDALVGRLLARLRETGLFDRCLLIVTADHGISFKINDGRRSVSQGNIADIMSVPLFIKSPGQKAGAVSERNVESIDIVPTIVDVLNIDLSMPVDGRSVFDKSSPERAAKTIFPQTMVREAAPVDVAARSTAAAELQARLGPPGDPQAIYRIGPHLELVGRAPRDLPADSGQPVEIELMRSDSNYTGERNDLVPCYFEGWVVSPFDHNHPVHIAVAVNGVIRAVTRTYRLDGARDHWSALISESDLQPGQNDVKYYSVAGESGNLRLRECNIKAAQGKHTAGSRRH
ncbi:MAG: sulfatase-like hydrolase/transferase [Planctomycetia bacterium]|nr:sulfatase-like hydrolase/transferase [Planctomycetia bacterium]